MLEFLRTYQRYFFFVITFVVIASFTFFGTYSTFGPSEERPDRVIGSKIDGSPLKQSEVQVLARFLSTDREDPKVGRGPIPNLCNDGVIRKDFLKGRLAELLVRQYLDLLRPALASRLDLAKRFRTYAHPEAPYLSAKAIWDHLSPEINRELAALQEEKDVSAATFSHLAKLFVLQSQLHPETLRRILIYQHQQFPWLTIDQNLSTQDLALFGFHSATDWFGRDFVDLVAEFILNTAVAAEQKGYSVSLEEAKGDLIHTFQESMQKAPVKPDLNFHAHLRSLGMDEKLAAESWKNVLLFRRYFQDVGEAAFVDSLPYKDFSEFSKETAVVQKYEWPIALRNGKDLAEFQFYLNAVCPKESGKWPSSFLSVEEVGKKVPELVETAFKAQVVEITKSQVGLRATLRQVLDWQTDGANWSALRKEFSLPEAKSKEERFKVLEKLDPKSRVQIDAFARSAIVDLNPSWIDEALAAAPLKEQTWSVSGLNPLPVLKKEGSYFRIENPEKAEETHILPFAKARPFLAQKVGEVKGELPPEKNPFFLAAQEAIASIQKNPDDSRWVQSGQDPLADQFKLRKEQQSILRTSKENWMKEQAFIMFPNVWSPIHAAEDGQIVFFYLQEKKVTPAPMLDILAMGKETLASDAKAYVAERLLETIQMKNAMVIPVQKEEE